MLIRHNVLQHDHITMEDLKKVARIEAAGVDGLEAEEKDRYYEIKDKIAECPECRRRTAVAAMAKKIFGRQIWDLKREAAFTVDLRGGGRNLELLKILR